ncbi:hypothetical protein KKG46_05635 [Patescibacteria group bacterium]|nr:hypothetical protein [Patescibacteria group bacterium]
MTYDFWKKAGIATAVIGALSIAGATFAQTNTAQNVANNLTQRPFVQGMMGQRHGMGGFNDEAVKKAIDNRDYNAFVTAVTPENGNIPKILETITADNFDRFVDMHEALKNQDFETAKSIAKELGLSEMDGRGMGQGQPMHTEENQLAIREAAINGDYQTWFDLVAVDGQLPEHLQVINADNFSRFSEMHQLMDDAKTIREELGLEGPQKGFPAKGIGRGMHGQMGQGMGLDR